MNVLLLTTPEKESTITGYIRSYQPFFNLDDEVSFQVANEATTELTRFDRIILDEENLDRAVKLLDDLQGFEKVYIWLFGALVPVSMPNLIETASKRFLAAKNWTEVKHINKIKINLNRLQKKVVLDSYPSQLQLESTSFCNARCIMCSHYYAENSGATDMTPKLLDKLKELFPYLQIIIMHGNGEPFISKTFQQSVDTYAQYGIVLTTNTNLSVLDQHHISSIRKSFVNIRVSCDGCTKEIYEGIRRGLSFNRFVRNLETLKEECNSVTKTMATVMMRQNIEQLPEMVEFAAKSGFEEIIFSNLGPSLLVGNEKDNTSHYPYLAAKQLRHALEVGRRCGILVTIPSAYDLSLDDEAIVAEELAQVHSMPFFRSDDQINQIKEFAHSVVGDEYRIVEDLKDCIWEDHLFNCQGICEWCIEKPYIDLAGNVFVCCINASYRVGNVFEYDSFIDLWNNPTYQKIRQLFYSGKLPGFCDNCQFILNHSLSRLEVPNPEPEFYQRRHISKFYFDYCEEHKDEK